MTRPLPERETREAQARALLKQLDTRNSADRTELALTALFGSPRR